MSPGGVTFTGMSPLGLAVVFALLSAAGTAVSTGLQHHVAGAAPVSTARGVLSYVVRRPVWLASMALSFVSMLCHAIALNQGAVALVQPLIISGVVFAVIFRALLDRTRPHRDELVAVVLTIATLAVFISLTRNEPREVADDSRALAFFLIGYACLIATYLWARRTTHPRRAAMVLGVASGFAFGLVAGLLKLIGHDAEAGGLIGVVGTWHVYALPLVGVVGLAMNQLAFHLAPLALSMPMLNVVDVLVAICFAALVYAEYPTTDPLRLVALAVCLVVIALGLRMIARAHDRLEALEEQRAEVA
ncbi:DMT family transporter [Alteromonas gracilis]